MPRPNMKQEKAKDLKGTLLRIFKSLNTWRFVLILSCVLALLGAILSTIAPNRLAKVTDVITESIKPNTKNIEILNKQIQEDLKNKKNVSIYIDKVEITYSDQMKYLSIISKLDKNKKEEDLMKTFKKCPKSIQEILNTKMDTNALKERSIVLGIIYLVQALFSYIVGLLMAYIGIGYSKKLRKNISTKINKLPLKYFDTHEIGDVLSRVTNDVDTIGINMSTNINALVTNLTLFLGSIVMMFITNWIMALTAIIASIFGFMFTFVILGKSQKYFTMRQKELGNLNGHIEEIYSGQMIVKAYNGEKDALMKFDKINDKLYDANRKSQFLSGIMQPLMNFVGNFGYVAVCVVGALLAMNNHITFGVIVAFMIYIRLFTNPLSRIAQSMTSMQSIAAAAERVYEFMDEEELTNEKNMEKQFTSKVKGNIEFKNVKFGYSSDKTIIKDFSAKVKDGEKIAIVGPTGAGKTTMVNLLMKFYEINDGDILIDGVSIKNISREELHNLFVMVLQDTWLFEGSIKDNLKFNNKNISTDTLWDISKKIGIDHFIKTLPNTMDSSVTDNEAISSGQKQLLTIARGMVKDAPFLILDEATSNVDTRTEELVQIAMDKLMEGKTSFIIAHRLSTIKNADLILVMNEGNIVEQGTHKELLKKNGFYANLYNSQFQK